MTGAEREPRYAKLVSLPLVRTQRVRRKWADEEGNVIGPIDDDGDQALATSINQVSESMAGVESRAKRPEVDAIIIVFFFNAVFGFCLLSVYMKII